MRYCALIGDIEWYEDALIDNLTQEMTNVVDKYGSVTFIAAPMCVYNGRVSGVIEKVKKLRASASFVLCAHRYTADYVAPGEPFDTIVIPADINKVEDFYPYMCRWIIEKCETAVIYVDRKSVLGKNPLSVNALALAEHARSLGKELMVIKPSDDALKQIDEKEKNECLPDDFFDGLN